MEEIKELLESWKRILSAWKNSTCGYDGIQASYFSGKEDNLEFCIDELEEAIKEGTK